MALQYVQIKAQVDLYGNKALTCPAYPFTTPDNGSGGDGNGDNSDDSIACVGCLVYARHIHPPVKSSPKPVRWVFLLSLYYRRLKWESNCLNDVI